MDSPQRVAALIGSFADVWCLAGGKDLLVAAAGDSWTSFDLGLDESVVDLGGVGGGGQGPPDRGGPNDHLYVRHRVQLQGQGQRGFPSGEMLADLGCVNVADGDDTLLENLSLETVLAADPDYIFVALQGSDPAGAMETLEQTLLSNPA